MKEGQGIAFISVASGWGARHRETELGPSAFEASTWDEKSLRHVFHNHWAAQIHPTRMAQNTDVFPLGSPEVHTLNLGICQQLAGMTRTSITLDEFPIPIGGDHLMAVGTWSGIIGALEAPESFGLIWIDAHMDSHTPETTPSQAYHGMPLAMLLGYGHPDFINLDRTGPKLAPQHVALVGVHSFEEAEQALLSHLGVRIYYREEIHQRGFMTVFEEALARATTGTKAFGVSLDLDAFDPQFAPGVGSPEPGGLDPKEVLPALKLLHNHPSLAGFEIAEYNPIRDHNTQTAQLMWQVLKAIL